MVVLTHRYGNTRSVFLRRNVTGIYMYRAVTNFIFFFQAEDGIRDRSVSRGLGDVYKRQDYWGI